MVAGIRQLVIKICLHDFASNFSVISNNHESCSDILAIQVWYTCLYRADKSRVSFNKICQKVFFVPKK